MIEVSGIEIMATGGLATVQDLGRYGSLRYGVGVAGAMDRLALAAANLLLGNDADAAAIEIPMFPFSARFTADCAFALTGADCAARLGARALLPWSVHRAGAGEELVLGPPRGGALRRACRAYLALAGGADVPAVLGSRSTQLRGAFGGFEGRALRNGDVLGAAAATPGEGPFGFGLVPPGEALPLHLDGLAAVRVLPAAEYPHFTPAARDAFWAGEWKITAQSDRYGYRLAGVPLAFKAPVEMLSHGIVPGVIQVPPGGQPIVQMRDAQPSGGYPKLGTVIEADLWRLGQAPVGSLIRFIETDWEAAVAAADAVQAWLDEAARLVELRRSVWEQAWK
jgi:biotin-dependent carboxylase-like uncharacterized protein